MDVLQDLRFAARALYRNPGFTLVAVITLALGIGANTAIFSVVDGVLLRPAPFADSDRLMMVWETDENSGTTSEPASLPDYLDFRERAATFETLAGFDGDTVTVSAATGEPLQLPLIASTHEFLPMVGIEPVLGRSFTESESRPGGSKVVLISEALWEHLYARDPAVLGRTIRLDGQSFAAVSSGTYEIVGVVPDEADFGVLQVLGAADYARGFAEDGSGQQVALWTPLQRSVKEWPRSAHPMFIVGRLAPGVGPDVAQQEMAGIAAELEAMYPENDGRGVRVQALTDVVFGGVRPALLLLLASVGLVLLVACANVANLLLARAAGRGRDVAVRVSLGAGAPRLARQFLVEGLLLALLGGAAGIGVAVVGTEALLALAPAGIPRLDEVGIHARVLAVTLTVSVLVGVVFGLVPTFMARGLDIQSILRSESGVAGAVRSGRGLLQSGLVVAELALAVLLVVGTGLLLKSLWEIRQVDPGFRAEGVLKAQFLLPDSRYPVDFSAWPNLEEIHRFNAGLLERVRALPGIESVAIAVSHPMDHGATNSFTIVGREGETADLPEISTRVVSPGYFATVALALRKGRMFDDGDDTQAPAVVIINEAAAKLAFPDRDPIGQSIAFWSRERRIVGVVADERFHGLTAKAPIAVYAPLAQSPPISGGEALLVRAGGSMATLAAAVRKAVHDVDPQLAVFGVEPLRETVSRSIAQQRFTMLLLSVFATVAIALAVIGIHGVLSYIVARRTSEMGLRMALGATPRNVLGLVAGQGARLALLGLALGLAGALVTTRLLESLLYGVTASDPATYAAVAALVFAAAMLATFVPAHRATKVTPVEALRHE